MVIFLFVIGTHLITCVPGVACVDNYTPLSVLLASGFEFVTEIIGIKIFRKVCGR